ncbi:hypothetical protein TNCV_908011 [Trichonephila clavipes]|nr:hypothetical protein TNCV_908011 [Trichonephila clavipes]
MVKNIGTPWAKSKGRSLFLLLCLHAFVEHNGTTFNPWVTFQEITPPTYFTRSTQVHSLVGNEYTLRRPAGIEGDGIHLQYGYYNMLTLDVIRSLIETV